MVSKLARESGRKGKQPCFDSWTNLGAQITIKEQKLWGCRLPGMNLLKVLEAFGQFM